MLFRTGFCFLLGKENRVAREDLLMMKPREIKRLHLIHQALEEKISQRQAAEGPAEVGFAMHFSDDDLSVKRAHRRIEREMILRALERTAGNRTHAAKLLDLSHRALLYKVKDYGID